MYKIGDEEREVYGSVEYLLSKVEYNIGIAKMKFCIVCLIRTHHNPSCLKCGYVAYPIKWIK